MKRYAWFILFVLLFARGSSAQTVTSYSFKIFNQGASSPISTTSLPATGFTCGSTKITATGTVQNPRRVVFDDPADGTKDCLYTDAGAGPLLSLPFGSQVYVATLAAANAVATSPDSAPSNPFAHPGTAPPPPTGVRVAQ